MRPWITKIIGVLLFFGGSYFFFHYVTTQALDSEEKKKPTTPPSEVKQHIDLATLKKKASSYQDREVSVYYIPHPNDEILTYGVSILNDLQDGKTVFLVLLTHDQKTVSLTETSSNQSELKAKEETASVKAFYQSSDALGLSKQNRLVYSLKSDDDWKKQVKQIALTMEKLFPKVTHHGMSDAVNHPEHGVVGEVLNQLYSEQQIKKRINFASVFLDQIANQAQFAQRIELKEEKDGQKIDRALKAYPLWDPENGWTACGYTSPEFKLDQFSEKKYSLITTSS